MRLPEATLVIATALVFTGYLVEPTGAQARSAKHRVKVVGQLHATGADPNAEGKFEENVDDGVSDGTGAMSGDLRVKVRHLAPRTTFGVKVGETNIGTLTTARNGMGRARFRATPLGRDQKLAADPRGQGISLTDPAGEDVLDGVVSDPTTPGGTQCCLNSADEQGCDILLAAACTAAGGDDLGAGTCEPDPCPGQPGDDGESDDGPPPPGSIACCLNTADEQGCTELLPADCQAAGGAAASAPTCEPDPCPGQGVEDPTSGD